MQTKNNKTDNTNNKAVANQKKNYSSKNDFENVVNNEKSTENSSLGSVLSHSVNNLPNQNSKPPAGIQLVQLKTDEKEKTNFLNDFYSQSKDSGTIQQKVNNENITSQLGNSFNTDFSNVNLHQNSETASNLGALAFTQGNNVHFAPGKFNPESKQGKQLIGHEFAHVVQQRQGKVQSTKQIGKFNVNDNSGLEKEADYAGEKFANSQDINLVSNSNISASDSMPLQMGGPPIKLSGKDDSSEKSDFFGDSKKSVKEKDEKVITDIKLPNTDIKLPQLTPEKPLDKEVKTAIELIASASKEEIEKVATAYTEYKNSKTKGGASGSIDAKAETTASVKLSKKGKNIVEGINVLAEANIITGVSLNIKAEYQKELGPFKANLESNISSFVGFLSSAGFKAEIGLSGLKIEASASAEASAKISAAISSSLKGKIGEIGSELTADAFAGALTSAEGKIEISPQGITFSGSVEAFAGAKGKVAAKTFTKLKIPGTGIEQEIFSASVSAEAMAGVGGKIGGSFSLKGGKLSVSIDLGAALGLGGSVSVSVNIDFMQLLQAIAEKLFNHKKEIKEEIIKFNRKKGIAMRPNRVEQ